MVELCVPAYGPRDHIRTGWALYLVGTWDQSELPAGIGVRIEELSELTLAAALQRRPAKSHQVLPPPGA